MPGGSHLISAPIATGVAKRPKLRSVSPPTPTQTRPPPPPDSPGSPHNGADHKRRRFTSSPVRPWKSPSPQSNSSDPAATAQVTPASNLLRHISVIRETPPILKPQVVPPAYHVPHAAHHYHHLVDPYAAAYHLYKNGAGPAGTAAPPTATSAAGHSHHWGAYN